MSAAVMVMAPGFATLEFVVFCKAEPQGSKRAFVIQPKNGNKARAVVVDNAPGKLKPFRQEVTRTAIANIMGLAQPWAAEHVPVRLRLDFFTLKPQSCKKRSHPSVKPDIDKLCRSTIDSLTGILFKDDAQIVQLVATKNYGDVEKVRIKVELLT